MIFCSMLILIDDTLETELAAVRSLIASSKAFDVLVLGLAYYFRLARNSVENTSIILQNI